MDVSKRRPKVHRSFRRHFEWTTSAFGRMSFGRWLRRMPRHDEVTGGLSRAVATRRPMVWIAAVFAIGVASDQLVAIGASWFVGLSIGGATAWAIVRRRDAGRLAPAIVWIGFFATVLALGGLRSSLQRRGYEASPMASERFRQSLFESAAGTIATGNVASVPQVVRSPLADSPTRRPGSPYVTRFEMDAETIRSGRNDEAFRGRVIVHVDAEDVAVRPGDRVRVFGAIEPPRNRTNPGDYDEAGHFRRRGLHARMLAAQRDDVELVRSGGRFHPMGTIAEIASFGREALLEHVGPRAGPLAIGLVLGQRDALEPRIRDQLLMTGTVHLLSVSGLHLAIVVALLNFLCRLFSVPRIVHLATLLAGAAFYTALTGGRPPVLRAAILVTVLVLAVAIQRRGRPLNTLAIAALLLLVWQPSLLQNVGVHLSFLAVGTLMLAGATPPMSVATEMAQQSEQNVEALLSRHRGMGWRIARMIFSRIGGWIRLSAAVTAVSTPLIWYHFHVVTPIAVFLNVVLSPLLFAALAAGLATVASAACSETLASVFGWVTNASVASMLRLVEYGAGLPLGHAWLPSPSISSVVVFYVVLMVTLWLPRDRPIRWLRGSWLRGGWVVAWCVVQGWWVSQPPDRPVGSVRATFVDVGHGTAVVVESDEQTLLYDCGKLGNDRGLCAGIDGVLWDAGHRRLDAIVLSHADADHFNALPALVRRFGVDRVVTPPGMLTEDEPALQPIVEAIARHDLPVQVASADSTAEGSPSVLGPRWTVAHPPASRQGRSDNANSLVMITKESSRPLILPGDLEPPGTAVLTSRPRPRPGGVLMAPHHGSLYMDAESVLQWSRPSVVVVSGGRRAKAPEVETMLRRFGADVWITARDGAIRTTRGRDGRWRIERFDGKNWIDATTGH